MVSSSHCPAPARRPPSPAPARRRRLACTAGAALAAAAPAAAPAAAQAPGVHHTAAVAPAFSLADALALARAGHPLLRAAAGRRQAAVGAARQDAALFNPLVEARRENLGSPLAPDDFVTATLGTDAYGRRLALRGLVAPVAERAAFDSSAAGRTVEIDVARAYWRAALAAALRDVADAQRRAVDSLAGAQARRAREGAVAEGAALRTALEADRTRLDAAAALADAERARGELARALARPLALVPFPTEPLDPPPARVTTAPGRDPDPLAQPPVDPRPLVDAALRRRPEVLAARARVAEAERRARAERLGALPGLGAIGGYTGTAGLRTGLAGVFVSVPLFDRNQGARARSAGDLVAARAELQAREAEVAAEVEGSVRAYAALVADAPAGGTGEGGALAARGRDVAEITAVAYREGAATLLELLDAVRSRADVRAAGLRWAAALRLARLELDRATGAPLP